MVVELQHSTFKYLKVFITGTSSGIGHAVSKAYLERGSIVYGIDNKNNKSLNLQFKNFEFHNCNVQNYKKMSLIVKKILKKSKRIDVLIKCAGIIDFKSIEKSTIDFWKKIIDVNLTINTGSRDDNKIIAPYMKKNKKGSIINVSSRAAKFGGLDETAYCASKFGVEGLSRSLYEECKKYNVFVNTITPVTPIKTSMSKKTYSDEKRKIWKDPYLISPAFLHLGVQTKSVINNKYIDAWQLTKKIKHKYKLN